MICDFWKKSWICTICGSVFYFHPKWVEVLRIQTYYKTTVLIRRCLDKMIRRSSLVILGIHILTALVVGITISSLKSMFSITAKISLDFQMLWFHSRSQLWRLWHRRQFSRQKTSIQKTQQILSEYKNWSDYLINWEKDFGNFIYESMFYSASKLLFCGLLFRID